MATGKYYVDWGDGTTTGPHSVEGGPWPDGQITHEYIHIGAYDVVVTERWTATWSFGSESGTLDELRTVGRIDDFPVQQIQAVVAPVGASVLWQYRVAMATFGCHKMGGRPRLGASGSVGDPGARQRLGRGARDLGG